MKRITFSIGLTDSKGEAIPLATVNEFDQLTRHELATKLGGYSSYKVNGGWIDPKGKEFKEDSIVYYSLLDSSKLAEVRPLAQWLAGLWQQQAIMVTTEPVESMELVEAERRAA